MKIAIDISQITYEGTGVANYTKELVRNLLKVDKKNEYILFGTSFRGRAILQDYGNTVSDLSEKVSFKFLPLPQTFGNFLWNRIHRVNIETFLGKIDIFHSSDWIQPPTLAKKVTTVHDLVVYKYPETSHPQIVETQKRRLFWVKREVDVVLADSFSTKQDLVRILNFDPSKIKVIYPGVGDEYKPAGEKEITRVKQKYGLFSEYILAVGTREPRKNLKRVVATFERFSHHPLITAREKPVELIIVGKVGWGDQFAPRKYVRLLGYVEQGDLPALYSGAAVFVYPSLYEGFGLPVIEAMACGTPVVTSDRGSLKEITNGCALLVDPEMEDDIAVKLTKVVVDSNLRSELIKKGKENAANFNWEKTAKQIKEVYEKVASL